jgi:hypothetical protein
MLYPLAAPPTQTLIDFLTGHPVLAPLLGDRVSSYKLDTPLTRVQVSMIPAAPPEPGYETYEYQVDCWGPTDAVDDVDQAEELARAVRASIYDMRGTHGVIVASATSPFSLPDPDTGRPRMVCQVSFTICPEEP